MPRSRSTGCRGASTRSYDKFPLYFRLLTRRQHKVPPEGPAALPSPALRPAPRHLPRNHLPRAVLRSRATRAQSASPESYSKVQPHAHRLRYPHQGPTCRGSCQGQGPSTSLQPPAPRSTCLRGASAGHDCEVPLHSCPLQHFFSSSSSSSSKVAQVPQAANPPTHPPSTGTGRWGAISPFLPGGPTSPTNQWGATSPFLPGGKLPPTAGGGQLSPPCLGGQLPPPAGWGPLPPSCLGGKLPPSCLGGQLPPPAVGGHFPICRGPRQSYLLGGHPSPAVFQ